MKIACKHMLIRYIKINMLYCKLKILCCQNEVMLTILMSFTLLTKPNGPILGAKEDVAPTSPPTHLKYTKIKIQKYKT